MRIKPVPEYLSREDTIRSILNTFQDYQSIDISEVVMIGRIKEIKASYLRYRLQFHKSTEDPDVIKSNFVEQWDRIPAQLDKYVEGFGVKKSELEWLYERLGQI